MKKIFAVAIVGLTLMSCKKSSNPGIGTNGIQATIGGTASTFNILTTSQLYVNHYSATDSVFELEIDAEDNTNASSAHEFDIDLTTNKPFTVGEVFTDTSRGHDNLDPIPLFTKVSFDFYGYFDPYDMFVEYSSGHNVHNPATLTITAVSGSSISGTFQGPIYINSDTTKLSKQMTNAKFVSTYVNYDL